jgi:hypothetical protein
MMGSMDGSANNVPSCPECGIYLLVGMIPGSYLVEVKQQTGWRIARFDPGVSKRDADAIVTGCIVHRCPRCNCSLD